MDKKTYFNRLESALRELYPAPQVRDILTDYGDFFDSGAAEGKSEAELCAEFGPPEYAARELKYEGDCERPRHQTIRLLLSRMVLFFAVFLLFLLVPQANIFSSRDISEGRVNFWAVMLFPLLLEGIIASWLSPSAAPKKALRWVPRVTAIFAIPTGIDLILFLYFILSIPQSAGSFRREGPSGPWHMLMMTSYYGFLVSSTLLLVSLAFLVLYTIHGHRQAHWFLFLDTTLLTIFLNLVSFVGGIGPNSVGAYNPAGEVASCFLWAVLPNLAAAGITWAVRKIVSARMERRAKAWTDR